MVTTSTQILELPSIAIFWSYFWPANSTAHKKALGSIWIGTLVFTFFEKGNKLHYKPLSMGSHRSYASYMILISSSTWHKMTMNDNIQEKKFCLKKFKTQSLPWTMDNDNASRVKIMYIWFVKLKVKDTIIKWHAPTIIL